MKSYDRICGLLTEGSQGLQRKRRVLKAKRYIKDADVKGAEKAVKDRIAHGKKREGEPLEDRDKKRREGDAHGGDWGAEQVASVNRSFRAKKRRNNAGWPPSETTDAEHDESERKTKIAMGRARARGTGLGDPPEKGKYALKAQMRAVKPGTKADYLPKVNKEKGKRDLKGGWPPKPWAWQVKKMKDKKNRDLEGGWPPLEEKKMSYTDHIKDYIYEANELARQEVKKRAKDDVRSGKMSKKQRVARIWSDATRRGDTVRATALYNIYKRLEGISERKSLGDYYGKNYI